MQSASGMASLVSMSTSAAWANSSKSCAFHPTRGNSRKNGMIRDRISERRLTSQYQPPSPAFRIVPHASVSRNRSSGARSVCDTLKAAESLQLLLLVASWTTNEHEAGFSQREPDQVVPELAREQSDGESFLLIVRTRHIVTAPPVADGTGSAGYSEFPAYSRVLQLPRLIVTAAVYRGLASVLRAEALTPPRNLPAPGRRQPLYVVLRLSRDLCFW